MAGVGGRGLAQGPSLSTSLGKTGLWVSPGMRKGRFLFPRLLARVREFVA